MTDSIYNNNCIQIKEEEDTSKSPSATLDPKMVEKSSDNCICQKMNLVVYQLKKYCGEILDDMDRKEKEIAKDRCIYDSDIQKYFYLA